MMTEQDQPEMPETPASDGGQPDPGPDPAPDPGPDPTPDHTPDMKSDPDPDPGPDPVVGIGTGAGQGGPRQSGIAAHDSEAINANLAGLADGSVQIVT